MAKEFFVLSKDYRLSKGGVSSLANIISPTGDYLMSLNSLTDCQVYKVRKDIILNLLRQNSTFEEKCYKTSFLSFVRYLESKDRKYRDLLEGIEEEK